MTLELRLQAVLTVRAAIIEHMRWEAYNIPSTPREIADGIGRSVSRVRRVLYVLVREGTMAKLGDRYMLIEGEGAGARLLT